MSTFNFSGSVNAGVIGNTMPQPLDVKVKLAPGATMPTRGSAGAAGLDLFASGSGTISPGCHAMVKTGVYMGIPRGYYARVAPRSGLAVRNMVDVMAGVIDSDYRGEIAVVLINHGKIPFTYKQENAIAQLIIYRHEIPCLKLVDNLDDTERGVSGFGSTDRA